MKGKAAADNNKEVTLLDLGSIETYITQFPIYQYSFLKPEELTYSDKAKQLCRQNCSAYGQFWSCQPAVGKIEKCREHCLLFSDVLVFSTVSDMKEHSGRAFKEEAAKEHEHLTDIIAEHFLDEGYSIYTLTGGRCMKCAKCTFPRELCRFPDEMHPCIESHGLVMSDIADICNMDHYMGEELRLNFSLIFIKDDEVKEEEQ